MANRDKKLGKLHKKGNKLKYREGYEGAASGFKKPRPSKRYAGEAGTLFSAVVEVETGRALEVTTEPEGFRTGVFVDDKD